MTKKNLSGLILFLSFFILISIGCDWWKDITNSNFGSSSGSGSKVTPPQVTPPQDVPPHGQATVNILQQSPFNGQQLQPTYWTNLEAYCKAGPTLLIICDLNYLPRQMDQAGFPAGNVDVQYYGFSRTINGAFVYTDALPGVPELYYLYQVQDKIDAWWARYIAAIVKIMQKYPQTTAVIITNNTYPDQGGPSIAHGTIGQMSSVSDRVSWGNTVQDKSRMNFGKVRGTLYCSWNYWADVIC